MRARFPCRMPFVHALEQWMLLSYHMNVVSAPPIYLHISHSMNILLCIYKHWIKRERERKAKLEYRISCAQWTQKKNRSERKLFLWGMAYVALAGARLPFNALSFSFSLQLIAPESTFDACLQLQNAVNFLLFENFVRSPLAEGRYAWIGMRSTFGSHSNIA